MRILSLKSFAIDTDVRDSLQRKATDSYLRHDLGDGECFVTCPSSTCKGGAIMADGHIFTCPDCKARYCFSCNAPMHEDITCEAFLELQKREEEKEKEETFASETLKKHSKECPKCKARLQKNGGCDHFTCKFIISVAIEVRTNRPRQDVQARILLVVLCPLFWSGGYSRSER